MTPVKLISWNLNGIRACYKKGFIEFIEREEPDILAVQETKAHPERCEPPLLRPAGRVSYWSSAKKKGYSGVATFVRPGSLEPSRVEHGIGIEDYDSEGRFVVTEHEAFTLYNIYFVNGGASADRQEFKMRFLKDLTSHLRAVVAKGKPVIVTGDYNVAHRGSDVYDPVGLAATSGFLPVERAWFEEFLALGFIDTFRFFHPEERDRYTWWAYYENGRIGNRGWRIDYFCVTKNLEKNLVRAEILDGQMGSDHCPVALDLAF